MHLHHSSHTSVLCATVASTWNCFLFFFFFFNDTATTEIYTLSLHDALPIYRDGQRVIARSFDLWDWRAYCGREEQSEPRPSCSTPSQGNLTPGRQVSL